MIITEVVYFLIEIIIRIYSSNSFWFGIGILPSAKRHSTTHCREISGTRRSDSMRTLEPLGTADTFPFLFSVVRMELTGMLFVVEVYRFSVVCKWLDLSADSILGSFGVDSEVAMRELTLRSLSGGAHGPIFFGPASRRKGLGPSCQAHWEIFCLELS